MAQSFGGRYSGQRVLVKHSSQEIVSLRVYLAVISMVEIEITGPVLVQNLIVSSTRKDWSPH